MKWNQRGRGTIGCATTQYDNIVANIIRRQRKCTKVEIDIIALMPIPRSDI